MTPNQDRPVPGEATRMSPESRARPDEVAPTVYDSVVGQLQARGWVKGMPQKGEALCLVAAIDVAVGVGDAAKTGSAAAKLARAGRVGAHLRDLLGVRNLAAWSDEPSRILEDVLQLLTEAAVAFPED